MNSKAVGSGGTERWTAGGTRRARISVGLRNLSRSCRKEMLVSSGYESLRRGALTAEQYAQLLRAHYDIRRSIETLLDSVGETFTVTNISTGEVKRFEVACYLNAHRCKSTLLLDDIFTLTGRETICAANLPKVGELICYMGRVRDVYSIALLGALYVFEEGVTYAGPRLAAALDRQLGLSGRATSYLRGAPDQKKDFWRFRRSLDSISDFQTQVNIVTAGTITYGIYRELMDPHSLRMPRTLARLH